MPFPPKDSSRTALRGSAMTADSSGRSVSWFKRGGVAAEMLDGDSRFATSVPGNGDADGDDGDGDGDGGLGEDGGDTVEAIEEERKECR
eukprot:ANDGO_04281.mRNA.1 hypothetical protein